MNTGLNRRQAGGSHPGSRAHVLAGCVLSLSVGLTSGLADDSPRVTYVTADRYAELPLDEPQPFYPLTALMVDETGHIAVASSAGAPAASYYYDLETLKLLGRAPYVMLDALDYNGSLYAGAAGMFVGIGAELYNAAPSLLRSQWKTFPVGGTLAHTKTPAVALFEHDGETRILVAGQQVYDTDGRLLYEVSGAPFMQDMLYDRTDADGYHYFWYTRPLSSDGPRNTLSRACIDPDLTVFRTIEHLVIADGPKMVGGLTRDPDDPRRFFIGSPFDQRIYETNIPDLSACIGDVTESDSVGIPDLLRVLDAWGLCGDDPCPEDTNGNGRVDVLDLLNVLENWGACSG